jgi:SAM-dependent methyltransferase
MSETRGFDSRYDDEAAIAALVEEGQHRGVIGGLWDEIGSLQFEFLQRHGLLPEHHLLDVGCGSLRGGVHFAAYLQPGHYWGIDANGSLLDAGFRIELGRLGLTDRVPRTNLLHDREFNFERFGQTFDAAIAQSLFTHLSANRIRLCLARLAKVMRSGGRLYATYFEVPETHAIDEPYAHTNSAPRAQGSDDVRTYAYKDPFHYRLSEMEAFASGLSWRLVWQGDWNHPRSQKMLIFERLEDAHGCIDTSVE